jgi:hypothetical protein
MFLFLYSAGQKAAGVQPYLLRREVSQSQNGKMFGLHVY